VCPVVAIVAVAVALAACGGASRSRAADVARVKQVVHRALADLAAGDGRDFCGLATPAGQAALGRALPGYTCVALVVRLSRQLTPAERTGLAHAQARKVTIDGGRATVRDADIVATRGTLTGFLSADSAPTTLARQSDGSWKIEG
jgi:hypothetical protein